jgi:hypothetical protein
MLPKIAHYAGFQSYGDLPYPHLKPGRKALDSNTVYQGTVRDGDSLKFYDNHNRLLTVYDKGLSQTVSPPDYAHPTHVSKHAIEGTGRSLLNRREMTNAAKSVDPLRNTLGGTDTFNKSGDHFGDTNKGLQLYTSTVNSLKRTNLGASQGFEQHSPSRSPAVETHDILEEHVLRSTFLDNGTEHWKSTYNSSIKDPYALTRAAQPEWSQHKQPYQVEGGLRKSEYKTQMGERFSNPIDVMAEKVSRVPPFPKTDDDLKQGTTVAVHHLPGYTGHIPKNLTRPEVMIQATGSIARTTWLKQNIVENYHSRLPGYAGHRPRCAMNDRGSLRQSCFSTQGEKFY